MPSKPPHHRPHTCILLRCFVARRPARATLHLRSILPVENSSPCTAAAERNSAELRMQGNPAPPPPLRA